MRAKKVRTVAILAAAWAAAPSIVRGQSSVSADGTVVTSPSTGEREFGRRLPGYFGVPAVSPHVATSGQWQGPPDDTAVIGGATFGVYSGSWNNAANWTGNAVPDGGGSATIGNPNPPGTIERSGGVTVILDKDINLGTLSFTNPLGAEVTTLDGPQNNVNTGKTITTSASGLTINSVGFVRPFHTGSSIWLDGNRVRPTIVGSGSVTITGIAPLMLAGNNTFSGGLNVTSGATVGLEQFGASGGDPGLPQPNPNALGSGSVTLDNGTLIVFSDAATQPTISFNQEIHLGSGGGTFLVSGSFAPGVPAFFNGPITGPGNLVVTFTSPRFFQAANTYAGTTKLLFGTLTVQGNGALVNSPDIFSSGTFAINADSSGSTVNRLNDNANVNLEAGVFEVDGSSNFDNNETIGTLTASASTGQLVLNSSLFAGFTNSLTVGALARQNHAGIFIRAGNVGVASGDVNRLLVGNFASLSLGGGGAAGSTNRSIVPWVAGISSTDSTASSTQTGAGSGSFVAYDATRGAQPLNLTTEYAQSVAAAGATDNVRITATEAIGAPKTINALLMGSTNNTGTASSTVSGATLTISSGAIMNTSQGNVISAPINTGSAEAVVFCLSTGAGSTPLANNGLSVSGGISGSGGLTRLGMGNYYPGNSSSYSGATYLEGGRTVLTADVLPGQNSAFGNSTTPIHLIGSLNGTQGADTTRMFTFPPVGGTLTMGRDYIIEGSRSGATGVQIGNSQSGASTLLMSGNGTLLSDFFVTGTVNFSGSISGPGHFLVSGQAPNLTFGHDNSGWTGGAEFQTTGAAVFTLKSDNALGVGTVLIGGGQFVNAAPGGASITLPNPIQMYAGAATATTFNGNFRLTGDVDHQDFTRSIQTLSNSSIEFAGTRSTGAFRIRGTIVGTGTGSLTTFSTGTVTYSGPAESEFRTFVGSNPAIDVFYPGCLRLNNDNALGNAGLEMDSDTAQTQLVGNRTMPNRNAFIRGFGVDGQGSLRQLAGGTSTWAGNIIMTNSGTLNATATPRPGEEADGVGTCSVGVDAGAQLTVTGQLADNTGSDVTPDGGMFVKVGGGTLVLPRIADTDLASGSVSFLTTLQVNAGTLKIAAGATNNAIAGISRVKGVAVTGGALDLTNNAMVVDYTGASPAGGIRASLASGYAGGSWNGNGINSSSAAAVAASSPNRTAIGYAEASTLGLSSFGGIALDGTDVVLRYVYSGDSNLDGVVNALDFNALATNFGGGGKQWVNGDYNYDGTVNTLDFGQLAVNFNKSIGAIAGPPVLGSLVPEPTTLALLSVGALVIRRRRK